LVEADNEWLKKSDSEKRSVKMSLIEQHQPELIKKFEQEQSDKLMKKSKPAQKKAAAKVTVLQLQSAYMHLCYPMFIILHSIGLLTLCGD